MAKHVAEKGRIDVIVRKRPLNEFEINRGDRHVVSCSTENTVVVEEPRVRIDGTAYIDRHEFRVDRFYDENADNEQIYREYVRPLVEYAFNEARTCSCFTYGQTGSGKTFTMIGSRRAKMVSPSIGLL
ncbi:bifunctional Kinesin motor domain/P-loop containing nucleoside triphosphate hydrolase/Kinesin motor domain superfamily [Babesia duncani]|uniref:Bifunctional Kinesin motor domain/P-loop containing nucleoside triphosphate hydrolase/Kinesin motor domain superfamily n=1 Tax=Babesia duncani TaxID=323732 RepID=A0AAD9PII6_9APIC|nr:bifunctional Kinesin motor domain/P-loop containing nucleoside triphosphate hydrolase/Kinesin motor domain superfamily [Babesia duncani]